MRKQPDLHAAGLSWWYWLTSVRGLGPAYTSALLEAFGDPESVFNAHSEQIAQSVRLPSRALMSLENSKERLSHFKGVAERQARLASAMEAQILTLQDAAYPEFLRQQRKNAPPLIHVQGDLDLIRPQAVAIVGTRSPSQEAMTRVRDFSSRLSESGSPIVAGMAKGIDTAAHTGALDSSGMTIGVLGCGLDRIYPPENAPLYVETRRRGLLISQFPFGSAPSPGNLRQRNKLIVALSEAVVIAESDIRGGAMIAARAAVEQGRNLFALDWPQMDLSSRAGTKRLLESNLARPADDTRVETLFDTPVFRGAGTTPSNAWAAAFPEFRKSRSRNDSRRRSDSVNGASGEDKRPRRRSARAKQSTVAKRA